jgi:hypothetical protein
LLDWENLVRSHLRGLALDARREEEIVAELAGHLEEVFGDLRRRGVSESEAIRRSLDEIPNWNRLRRRLRRAARKEDAMNQRVKSLWIPGASMTAVALAGLSGAFSVDLYSIPLPITAAYAETYALLIYVPWLASLPLVGALGTYWSRRLGGNSATRLRACLIPVAVLAGMFLVAMPFKVFWVFGSVRSLGWDSGYLASCAVSWAVYPSLLLLLGALPFLRGDAGRTIRSAEVQN